MKIVNEELDDIRKQCKNRIKKLKIKHVKYLLMKNAKDLSKEQENNLKMVLGCSKRLKAAYLLKEDFRDIYETFQTPEEARLSLNKWMEKASAFYGSLGMAMSIVFFYTINPSSFIRKPCMARELLNISPSLHPDSQRAHFMAVLSPQSRTIFRAYVIISMSELPAERWKVLIIK